MGRVVEKVEDGGDLGEGGRVGWQQKRRDPDSCSALFGAFFFIIFYYFKEQKMVRLEGRIR